MNCLVQNDWGGLLLLWEKDSAAARREGGRRREQTGSREERERWSEEKEKARKRKNALSLLSRGLISKAVRTINSFGIGNMEDQETRQQMADKYPEGGAPLPPTVTKGQCVDSLHGLKRGPPWPGRWDVGGHGRPEA